MDNVAMHIWIVMNCLVQFSRSIVSDSLWPYGLQHTRLPCPWSTPAAYPNSCPSSQWCHPTISSSVVPFSSCPQSFPASGSFPVSRLYIHILQIPVWPQCETRLVEVVVTEGGVRGILMTWNTDMAVGAGRHDWIQETLRRLNLLALVLTGRCAQRGVGWSDVQVSDLGYWHNSQRLPSCRRGWQEEGGSRSNREVTWRVGKISPQPSSNDRQAAPPKCGVGTDM